MCLRVKCLPLSNKRSKNVVGEADEAAGVAGHVDDQVPEVARAEMRVAKIHLDDPFRKLPSNRFAKDKCNTVSR